MDRNDTLNELLVRLFRNVNAVEERAVRNGAYKDLTTNDIHVMEAVGTDRPKNMTTVARELSVTTGTLTIAVNNLVKKGYVDRVRSEEDRRVVLVSLTERGRRAYEEHQDFHREMIGAVVAHLDEEETRVLEKALCDLYRFFSPTRKG